MVVTSHCIRQQISQTVHFSTPRLTRALSRFGMPKFSITFLLVVVSVVAVGICSYQAWQHSTAYAVTKKRLNAVRERQEVYYLALRLMDGLDEKKADFNERIEQLVENLPSPTATGDPDIFEVIFRTETKVHTVSGGDSCLEVLSLRHNSGSVPGTDYIGLALFENRQLIDYTVYETSSRMFLDEIRLADVNQDGFLDIEITMDGLQGSARATSYDVSRGTFTQMDDCAGGITKR